MSERFEVGEVAVLCGITTPFDRCLNGTDVTIMSVKGARVSPAHYMIDSVELRALHPQGAWFAVPEQYLRKRPQPPDWNEIAHRRSLEIA